MGTFRGDHIEKLADCLKRLFRIQIRVRKYRVWYNKLYERSDGFDGTGNTVFWGNTSLKSLTTFWLHFICKIMLFYAKFCKSETTEKTLKTLVFLTFSRFFWLAQREGFEPSCGVIHKLISSQPRYDRFDTSAYCSRDKVTPFSC